MAKRRTLSEIVVKSDDVSELHTDERAELYVLDGVKRSAIDSDDPAYRVTVHLRTNGTVSIRTESVGEDTFTVVDLTAEAWTFLTKIGVAP